MRSNYNQEVIFLGCCFPIKLFKSIFNPFLSAIFVVFSQKSHLNRKIICFSLDFSCMDVPEPFLRARLCRLARPRTFIANTFTINA